MHDRQKNVRWLMDHVTELYATYHRLQHLHFIGHSNGTYVLASALANYKTLRVENIVFAGSVIRRDYPWRDWLKNGQVWRVRNYVGVDDMIVGLFPNLFELPGFGFFNGDLGSAGFNGFQSKDDRALLQTNITGGHDGALDHTNIDSIVGFIIHGQATDPPPSNAVFETDG